jgi:predicted metal-dependent hydrolase
MTPTDIFIIVIIAIMLVFFVKNHYGEVEYIKSSIDKRYYLVRKLKDSQEAADYLAVINARLMKLVKHMMAKYSQSRDVNQLYEKYNPNAISEGSSDSGYTSYSFNKGEKLILCIRQPNKDFIDKNVVMYVAIHELGHIMTKEVGHTDGFWQNFEFLLNEAMDIGLYVKVDFINKPADYCGIKIKNSIV